MVFLFGCWFAPCMEMSQWPIKVALGVCFALKSWKEYLLLFTYLITLGKDVTLIAANYKI